MSLEIPQQGLRAVLAGATALGLTAVITPLVRAMAVRLGLITKPLEDRWGRRAIARLGGVAMFIGFMAATLSWVPLEPKIMTLLIAGTLVFGVGLVDDLRRMQPYTKLVAQLLVGCVAVVGGLRIELIPWPWMSIPLSILWLVFIMNAFNLLDNMDGLAAGIGGIAALFCAFHAALANQWTVAAMALIVSGACIGFLRYNFAPAKIFMGDSGSHLLGLSLAGLALLGTWRHSTQLLMVLAGPTLVLAVPIFDTCFVTLQRLAHRQHPFIGGTDHVSHRLAILGLSTRQTVVVLYLLSFSFGMVSVVSATFTSLIAAMVWLCALAVLVLCGRFLAQVKVYRLADATTKYAGGGTREDTTLIETMLLHKRRLIEILVDFILVVSAYIFAHLLRFEGSLSAEDQGLIVRALPVILVLKLACFAGCGLYRGVWRYLSLRDVMAIVKAATFSSILCAVALLYLWRFEGYSRAVFVIDWMLCLFAVGGSRMLERLFDEWIRAAVKPGVPILIIGAGDTGAHVLRMLRSDTKAAWRVVGFLDDDPSKQGERLHGATVLGTRHQLGNLLDRYEVREVLIAVADPPGDLLEHIRNLCMPREVAWKVVTAGVIVA
jgi:UDP-GlcNAc:undecaprenyl-phosphate GlcNAc-1-phosphate transferase